MKEVPRSEANRSFELAYHLAARAVIALSQTPPRSDASGAMGRVLTQVEAASGALDAGEPTRSIDSLKAALKAAGEARVAVARPGPAPRPGADPGLDLVEEATRAIERAIKGALERGKPS